MKKIIKEYEVYSFNELPEEVKEKVIEKNMDINETSNMYDFMYEDFINDMSIYGIDIPDAKNISWSGFWSQGDGLSFTGTIDAIKYINHFKLNAVCENFISEVLPDKEYYINIAKRGHYEHENTMYLNDINYIELTEKAQKEYEELETELLNFIRRKAVNFYKELEKEYERVTSKEAVRETLIDIDNDYLIDGSVFRG